MNPFATAALLVIAIAQFSMAYMAMQPTPDHSLATSPVQVLGIAWGLP